MTEQPEALDRDDFAKNILEPQLMISISDLKHEEFTWWDWTVFLLHTAAEVEHGLLVQYLYASYSVRDPPYRGSKVPSNSEVLTKRWRNDLSNIARQEMAHLATVQNLLRFIGGPLNLDREDFPFRSFLYPFKFNLEPLNKTSLAKYVSAEMPKEPGEPLITEILQRATGTNEALPINRVGELYEELISIFIDKEKLPDLELHPHTASTLQARREDWVFGDEDLLVREITSRKDAIEALASISEQGEGLRKPQKQNAESRSSSHFEILLQIYKEYPETEKPITDGTWFPAYGIPSNPTTLPYASTDPSVEKSRITNRVSRLWCHLFNIRYRMLIMYLLHVLTIEGPMIESATRRKTNKGYLHDWAFNEMRNLRQLALKIVQHPLRENEPKVSDNMGWVAAPPFELPYLMTLPDRGEDRWRLYLSLITGSAELIEKIRVKFTDDPVLKRISDLDETIKKYIVEFQPNDM